MTGRSDSRLDGAERGFHLVQVAESLEDKSVHLALQQSPDLPAEEADRFLPGGGAPGLQPDAQRADGSDDEGPALGRPTGKRDRGAVDGFGLVVETVARQLDRIGSERVGLQDLGPGLDVRFVDLLHQSGLGEVQLIVADVHEHPAAVQHRAHGPIEDMDPLVGDQVGQGGHLPLVVQVGRKPALD